MTPAALADVNRDPALTATAKLLYHYLVESEVLVPGEVRAVNAEAHASALGMERWPFSVALDRLVTLGYLTEHGKHRPRRFSFGPKSTSS